MVSVRPCIETSLCCYLFNSQFKYSVVGSLKPDALASILAELVYLQIVASVLAASYIWKGEKAKATVQTES